MSDITELIAHALVYHWASRLFAYPDLDLRAALRQQHVWGNTGQAIATIGGDEQAGRALEALRQAFATEGAEGDFLAAEYTRLFARDVLCPPYESSYGVQHTFSRVQNLSELAGLYGAFGLKVTDKHPELHDHISLELEFLSVLYSKEALALEEGWAARARRCRRARRKLIREHLSWLPFFADKLRQHASLSFYPSAIAWVEMLLEMEPDYAPLESAAQTSA